MMEEGAAAAETTKNDRWGYPVRTDSDACISAINCFYREVLAYGRNRAVILKATEDDPSCVLANALAATFLLHQKPTEARSYLAAAASRLEGATNYEKAVFKAIDSLLTDQPDEDAAVHAHSDLLRDFPKDLTSLKRVQIVCFYTGRPDVSLNLVQQVLPYNQDAEYIHGMLSFPLLELGRMADAEAAARKGVAVNPHDFWSQHNLCHVLQNDCRFPEAVEFMHSCSPFWPSCSSFMYSHNWWHVAVCYLEGHAPLERVLTVYDQCVMKELERSDADPAEVYLNALGLLLRIAIRGWFEDIQGRLETVTSVFAKDSSLWNMEWLLDILVLWALSAVKDSAAAGKLLDSIKSRVEKMSGKKQESMKRALVLAEAAMEYGNGNLQKAYDLLGPEFDAIDYKMIGASDEQIDVFNEVWYIVLLETGHGSLAVDLLRKRVGDRGGAPFLWRLLEKAYYIEGDRDNALVAAEKAKALEAAYFN